MTDREFDFGEARDTTAANCREKNGSGVRQLSAEKPPHGPTANNLSAVAAQLAEAAGRAHEGDHEATKAHIAHAVALLQRAPPRSAPTDAQEAATGKRQVAAGGPLAWHAYRPIGRGDANFAQRNSTAGMFTTLCSHQLDPIRLRRVLRYILANIDHDITLVDLAGIADYSPFHFARKFTLAMGVSPLRYVTRMRLHRAMTELAMGKLPLAEVAFNAHFSSQSSFTRAFRRETSLTPKQYQRRSALRLFPRLSEMTYCW